MTGVQTCALPISVRQRIKIKLADGKERTIQHMTATTFWSVDGRPMSAAEFIKRLFGELPALFKNEDEQRALWSQPDTRKALLDSLAEKGYGREQLREIERMIDAEKSDLYDALAYIAFALSPITRQERADAGRPFITAHYDPKLQAFLDFVLTQYVSEGVGELDQAKLPHLLELRYRAISDAALDLGGVAKIREAFVGFQPHLEMADGPSDDHHGRLWRKVQGPPSQEAGRPQCSLATTSTRVPAVPSFVDNNPSGTHRN